MPSPKELKILLILGTGRTGRESEKVAKFVYEYVSGYGFAVQFIDVKDYPQVHTEEKEMKEWKALATAADGFVIVSPEYNHGYPGELKMFLDSAYSEYAKKPVAIVGVSNGAIGGARMVEQLRLVLTELGMVICRAPVMFVRVQDEFDGSGKIKNPENWEKRMKRLCEEIDWYGHALKTARGKDSNLKDHHA